MSTLLMIRLRTILLLAIWVVRSFAIVEIDVPYEQLIYLPNKSAWSTNPDDSLNCRHISSNATDAALQYTFTGSAIAFYLLKAPNGANVAITFSDGEGKIWWVDTVGSGDYCNSPYNITFPEYQFKPLMVTLRPTEGRYLNIRKLVVTSLTMEEQNSLASTAPTSTSRLPTQAQQSARTQSSSIQAQAETISSSNTATMIGGILGGILGTIVIGILFFIWFRRRRRHRRVDLDLDSGDPGSDSELLDAMPFPWVPPPSEFDVPPPEYSAAGPSASTSAALEMQQLPLPPASSPFIPPAGMIKKKIVMPNPSTPLNPF